MKELHWAPCELHCHTCHSDGKFTPESLVQTAKERLLEGIALTDHNTYSGYAAAKACGELPVLEGMEWTTYYGHMPVLGCEAFVDWRDATPETIDEKMREVKKSGGLVGMAHPFQLGSPICTGGHWDFNVQDFTLVDYLEVFSEGNPFLNDANCQAIALWHSLLDRGFHIAPTFGRDWHNAEHDLYPAACTYLGIEGEITAQSMKKAIKNGRTAVSVGPLFSCYTEEGETCGDTVNSGKTTVKFTVSNTRLSKFPETKEIEPREIRFLTNHEREVLKLPLQGETTSATLFLESGHWYSAELWGKRGREENTLLSVLAPIYTEEKL